MLYKTNNMNHSLMGMTFNVTFHHFDQKPLIIQLQM